VFGLMALLVVGGMGVLALLLTRLAGGDGRAALLVWLGGCSLALALPLLALALGLRAWRSIALPLGSVMEAADALAGGDLSARVAVDRQGEFSGLARSFNRMASELERAEQARRNLTADVAHELRTPLHIIQGNLEGVLDGVYEPTPQHINDTLEETQLLARLVDDLQLLALAEAGELPLQLERVDVRELLADVATSFGGQAQTSGVSLGVSLPDGGRDLTVTGDAGRLDQVLGNLVANAIRHTAAGGAITLSASAQDGAVEITVADSGSGIAEEELPYIFDRFWRGDKARSGTGSGLGLAIARQLVLAHQGRIDVTSTVGQGTTFTVILSTAGDTQV
jgi:signal transduction histidine kinase